jgi:hypothetical protein
MSGIMKVAKSKISEVMIKFNGAFMLSDETILNERCILISNVVPIDSFDFIRFIFLLIF